MGPCRKIRGVLAMQLKQTVRIRQQVAVVGPRMQRGDVPHELTGLAPTTGLHGTDLLEIEQRKPAPQPDVVIDLGTFKPVQSLC